MRTLFSLSITSENRELILTAFSKIANEKIQGARRIELQRRIEKQNMIPYVLFLWLGFVILNMIASIRFFLKKGRRRMGKGVEIFGGLFVFTFCVLLIPQMLAFAGWL